MREIIKAGKISAHTKLYRYINLSQFLSFIESKKTYLTKVKTWQDTWEVPESKIPVMHENGKIEFSKKNNTDDMFGQCWSLTSESDALWRIYSSDQEGLLIQTSTSKFDIIEDIKFGMIAPVIYYRNLKDGIVDLENREDYHELFGQAFLKRQAFEHEKEVRLVTINNPRCLGIRYDEARHIYVDLDPLIFIEKIIIDPRASDWYVKTIQKYCKRVGFEHSPSKSELYSPNIYEATRLTKDYISD